VTARITWQVKVTNLMVEPGLAGTSVQLDDRDGVVVSLAFGDAIDRTRVAGDCPERPVAYAYSYGWAGGAEGLSYSEVEVVAEISTDVAPVEGPGFDDQVVRLRRRGFAAANSALTRFVDLLASVGDHPLFALVEPLPQQHMGQLTLGAPPQHVGVGHDPVYLTAYAIPEPVPSGTVSGVAQQVAQGDRPSLAWELWLDANRRLRLQEDSRHAIVSAASAVEIGTRRGLVLHDPSPVAELLVETTRANDRLLKHVSQAILGKRFLDDDKDSYDLIRELLEDRNDLVHKGELPDPERLPKQLRAVRLLLLWLDEANA